MKTKRIVIRVRYRNQSGTLSRPHKIQKIEVKGVWKYFTMNRSREIDPTLLVFKWEDKNRKIQPVVVKETSIREIIRVKFHTTKNGESKLSRPVRVYKITTKDVVKYIKYPSVGYAKEINPKEFVTDWKRGKTPRQKPLRKYTKDQLKQLGYSIDEIAKLHRGFSAKDVSTLRRRMGGTKVISGDIARKLLTNHGGLGKTLIAEKETLIKVKKNRLLGSENQIKYFDKELNKQVTKHVEGHLKEIHKGYKLRVRLTKRQIRYKSNSRRSRKMIKAGIERLKYLERQSKKVGV